MGKILITAPTLPEIQPLINKCSLLGSESNLYTSPKFDILITGAGMMPYTFSLMEYLSHSEKPDLIMLAGIAGCFHEGTPPGTLYEVREEVLADCGAEDKDGNILTMDQLGIWQKQGNAQHFGTIYSNEDAYTQLPKAKSLCINLGSGTGDRIEQMIERYQPDIENMEGAALFMICQRMKIKFVEIRSISNFIEPRNRENWNIPISINRLNDFLLSYLPR
jgi:futalosine hydrolase